MAKHMFIGLIDEIRTYPGTIVKAALWIKIPLFYLYKSTLIVYYFITVEVFYQSYFFIYNCSLNYFSYDNSHCFTLGAGVYSSD